MVGEARGSSGLLVVASIAAGALGAAWGLPIMTRLVGDVDFPFHLATAQEFAATGRITMPHFLLQVVLGAFVAVGWFGTLARTSILFFTALYAMSAAAICWYVGSRTGRPIGAVLGVFAAVAVLMAAPIVPRGAEDLFLIGYFPPNVYHNPTMLVAKPLLVGTLLSAVAALTRKSAVTRGELVWLASPVILLGFAKPNYLACVAPAIVAAGGWAWLEGTRALSWARIAWVAGAAVVTLAATFALYSMLDISEGAGVVFAPLAVIGHYADVDAATIGESLLASFAFPLLVALLWPVASWRDPAMRVAWIGAAIGLAISYLFAEAGARMFDGNFLWTGQMAAFVLFVAAAGFVAERLAQGISTGFGEGWRARAIATLARAAATAIVLWLHVDAGARHVDLKLDRVPWLAFWM